MINANAEVVSVIRHHGRFYATVGEHTVVGDFATITAREAAARHFGVPEVQVDLDVIGDKLRVAVRSSAQPTTGWFSHLIDRFALLLGIVTAERIRTEHEIVVTLAENGRGGWSIYPANVYARHCFGGDEPAGNFATYADAWRVAVKCNEWTVTDNAALLTS